MSLEKKIENLLAEALKKPAIEVNVKELARQIAALSIEEEEPTGGVYCIEITGMSVADPVVFTQNNEKPKNDIDFALIKFGRTGNFATRFKKFRFTFEVIFKKDWDTTTEEKFKEFFPPNFTYYSKKMDLDYFFRAKVGTIKKYYKLKGDPAPTEWIIISSVALQQLKLLATKDQIHRFNYKTAIPKIFNDEVELAKGVLKLTVGNDQRTNQGRLKIKHCKASGVSETEEADIDESADNHSGDDSASSHA